MSANFYNLHASKLAQQYLSKTFEEVHFSWLEHLTPILNRANARILDIGAGAGRDSKYIAKSAAEQGKANNISVTTGGSKTGTDPGYVGSHTFSNEN